MSVRTPLVVGNWKMNTDRAGAQALARAVAPPIRALNRVEAAVCPPYVYLRDVREAIAEAGGGVALGAQDAAHQTSGAFTGEVSCAMLRDVGATWVIIGHSERRHIIGESDELAGLKTAAVLRAGLGCILCVGETLDERRAGRTDSVNERQLRAGLASVPAELTRLLVIAYEPVWAIGTGQTATPDDAQNAHAKIRAVLGSLYGLAVASAIRIQYGGSVKPDNARELFAQPDIDGGLIGGASLKAEDFVAIVRAAAS